MRGTSGPNAMGDLRRAFAGTVTPRLSTLESVLLVVRRPTRNGGGKVKISPAVSDIAFFAVCRRRPLLHSRWTTQPLILLPTSAGGVHGRVMAMSSGA